jgi:uncharacterized protein
MPSPLQIIKDHYAASARGDLEGMLAPLAEDAEWTEMAGFPYAGTYIGPAAVRFELFTDTHLFRQAMETEPNAG